MKIKTSQQIAWGYPYNDDPKDRWISVKDLTNFIIRYDGENLDMVLLRKIK